MRLSCIEYSWCEHCLSTVLKEHLLNCVCRISAFVRASPILACTQLVYFGLYYVEVVSSRWFVMGRLHARPVFASCPFGNLHGLAHSGHAPTGCTYWDGVVKDLGCVGQSMRFVEVVLRSRSPIAWGGYYYYYHWHVVDPFDKLAAENYTMRGKSRGRAANRTSFERNS